MGRIGDRVRRLLGARMSNRATILNGHTRTGMRTGSLIPLTMSMTMLAPHLPYSMALIHSHDADARGSESEDDIGNYLGGVGRG